MAAQYGMCDVHYSVERWFGATWTATEIAYPGVPFDSSSSLLRKWIAFHLLDVTGRPSRAAAYNVTALLTVNVFSRDSQRDVLRTAQDMEALLRAAAIQLYDESSQATLRGYLKLMDPALKALREQDGLHAGTVDVEGFVLF